MTLVGSLLVLVAREIFIFFALGCDYGYGHVGTIGTYSWAPFCRSRKSIGRRTNVNKERLQLTYLMHNHHSSITVADVI